MDGATSRDILDPLGACRGCRDFPGVVRFANGVRRSRQNESSAELAHVDAPAR